MRIHCFDFNSVELFEFIFNSELVRIEEDNLQKSDITCVRQFMYRERRKLFPAQPKYREEFHEILEDIGMVNNKHEDFVLVNDSENGIIMLGCDVEIFADGTFKCCPKYFSQLYTFHGFRNGHYIPLVFLKHKKKQ
jgi:hypothetical protein